MKVALITGISGQDGAYLSKFLLEKDYRVIGITRDNSPKRNLQYLGIENLVELIPVSAFDLEKILAILEEYNCDEVYHLAAQSSVGASFEKPIETFSCNALNTLILLEAIRHFNVKIRFFQASSSEVFGSITETQLPIDETFHFSPVSPYGISKASAQWFTKNYREAYGLYCGCGILFNHESVLRSLSFVTKKIANTAVKIKMGLAKELVLGNLEVYRDWGYAPEYVKCMWASLQQERADDYIICSGEANSLKDFVEKVFLELDLDFKNYVSISEKFYRPIDVKTIYGNNKKAKDVLGWNYGLSFDELIKKIVRDEMVFVAKEENKK